MRATHLARQAITLSTPVGRVVAWALATTTIFVAPYAWLSDLSLWQRLGLDWVPSIGLTRAYWLLIHGNPGTAFARNWLIVPVCIVGFCVIFMDLYHILQSTNRDKKAYTNDNSTNKESHSWHKQQKHRHRANNETS